MRGGRPEDNPHLHFKFGKWGCDYARTALRKKRDIEARSEAVRPFGLERSSKSTGKALLFKEPHETTALFIPRVQRQGVASHERETGKLHIRAESGGNCRGGQLDSEGSMNRPRDLAPPKAPRALPHDLALPKAARPPVAQPRLSLRGVLGQRGLLVTE